MKKLLTALLLVLALSSLSLAQLSGALSGNLGPGTYTVIDSIWVATGQTLTLAPGTTFNFNGAFGFGIAGTLHAAGTITDSIRFVPAPGIPFWKGIDFLTSSSTSGIVSYCRIEGANSSGIYINSAGPAISHCLFYNNSCVDFGGAIYSMYGTGSISWCDFINNTSVNGGAVVIRYTPVNVDNCLFTGNNGTYGGAMAYYFSTVCSITNCLFYGNSGNAGAGIRFSSSPVNVINCTFANNSAASGSACFNINQTSTYKNSVFWGNTGSVALLNYAGGMTPTYCDIQDSLWAGAGNISQNPLFVAGPNGAYYLSQTAAGQPSNSPCVNTGDPASSMIIGTTRTDQVQDGGIVDMGYHYKGLVYVPNVDVTLTPIQPPIVIPANGGPFNFTVDIVDNGPTQIGFAVWAQIKMPDGSFTAPTLGPLTINPPVGFHVNRSRTQNIPGTYPPGVYAYIFYAALTYPPTAIIDSSFFNFTKSTTADGGPFVRELSNSGELFPGEVAASTPSAFSLAGAYPNPFNPTTTISFTLPEAARVNLAVYDLSGRQVAALVNGWREAGSHQVTFDGSHVTSGIYFYTLSAGSHTASGKLVLMK